MDKKEFSTFVMAMRTYYSKENILPNSQAMELWFRELQDIPFPVAEAVLRKWVSTNKWSPSIAEIREEASKMKHGEIPDWGAGWEQVLKAIRQHGIYNPKKALESMDDLTRKTVERIGFRELCLSENTATDRANFRMCYEILAKREQVRQQVSLPLQETIEKIQLAEKDGMLKIGGLGEVGNENI